MPESDVASAPPERSSVYDFLYHDPHRIASFLAQFTQHGHLESLSRSESTAAATTNKSVVTGRAGVPTLGSVGRSGERAASESVTEALTTTYDPLWANALALLDHLSQHGLIRRDVTRASIGQFVLAQGELDILNLGTLRAAWAENPIRKLVFSGGASKGERAQMEAGFSFIKLLPHSIQAVLRGEIVVWCCLRSDGMTTPADDLLLKHGAAVSGKWSLVGILDALPDSEVPADDPPLGPEGNMGTLMRALAPTAREVMGRPPGHYGVTPLLVFREIGQAARGR